MDRTAKILLRLNAGLVLAYLTMTVSGFVLVRLIGPALARSLQTGPFSGAGIAISVAEYSSLPGRGGDLSAVSDAGTQGYSPVIRLQFPRGFDLAPAEIEGELRPATQAGRYRELRVLAPTSQTLPAQGLSLVIGQGKAPGGQAYRQFAAILGAENRQASVVVRGPRTAGQ